MTRGNKSAVVLQEQFYSCGLLTDSLKVDTANKKFLQLFVFDKEIYFPID